MAYRIVTAAALAVALAAPALAQEIHPAGPPLILRPSSSVAFQFPVIGNVFIANPEIASVQVHAIGPGGKALIYVWAKAPGKTTLFALGDDGEVVLSRAVEVPGPKTVRVLRGNHRPEIWSEAHEPPTRQAGTSLEDLPPGSTVTVPVGQPR